ncbi:PH domain-containing protein [Nocardiopsis gilva]|uniref:PH domain-containing protein n=1 Tax=Nocardiopsis gilva TaxID=280236 RepID=UPI000346C9CE|nr:PH domain-containing protein [Nocardiopsis gilva]
MNGAGPTGAAEDEAASAGPEAAEGASAPGAAPSAVDAAFAAPDGASWNRVAPVLAWYRRLILLAVLLPGAVLGGALIWAWSGWGWTIAWLLLCGLGIAVGWAAAEPARRSWGYAEGRTDFYLTYGVVVRQLVVVPYGRMQVVDVTSNLLEQALGIATLQVRTAATTADTRIPGIRLADAVELRDRLAARSETFSTGL